MKYVIENWTLQSLIDILDRGKLNLNPPYQRNPIWTKTTQKYLIQSIQKGRPIPNLFLFKTGVDTFEMVDGQQRTRAIKLYNSSDEINFLEDDLTFKNGTFLSYQIAVIIITEIDEDESIEDYYYMVNSSGIKLNRPETLKAQHFATVFLKLVEELTISINFQTLNIIPTSSQKRMLDRDLVEELCALILHGITDKKFQVDKIYTNDLNPAEVDLCRTKFFQIIDHLLKFNEIKPIKETRYRQRNDFYTLFSFLKDNLNIERHTLDYFYKILLQIEIGITPSRSACPILAEYAFNCVSQSNSAKARQFRLEVLNILFLNETDQPNGEQNQVKDFYPSEGQYFVKNDKFLTFNVDILSVAIPKKEFQYS